MTICFSHFSRRLFGHFKPRSPWRKWSLRPQIRPILCDVLNDEFLSRHSCFAAARQLRSHSLTVRAHLVYTAVVLSIAAVFKLILHKVV